MAGVTFDLRGDANDYVGKGLSGGKLIIRPTETPRSCPRTPSSSATPCSTARSRANATSAVSPASALRFATPVPSPWSKAVGDHGCEYMTGGVVVVIGETGPQLCSRHVRRRRLRSRRGGDFRQRCNMAMVDLEPVAEEDDLLERLHHHGGDLEWSGRVDVSGDMTRHDDERLHQLLAKHVHYTDSNRARTILDNWDAYRPKFVKVMPIEYRRALQEMERMRMGVAAE
jgi:glutamate synthase (NADPH/NADH) large chain